MKKINYISLLSLTILVSACGTQEHAPVEYGTSISPTSSKSFDSHNKISSKTFDIPDSSENSLEDKKNSEKEQMGYLNEKNKEDRQNKKYVNEEKAEDLDQELSSLNEDKEPKKEEAREKKVAQVILHDDKIDNKETIVEFEEEDANPLPVQQSVAGPKFPMPVKGKIITKFGEIFNGAKLNGVNIEGALGEPVHSVASGKVVHVGEDGKFGKIIIVKLEEGDFQTAYAYLQNINVAPGDIVVKGQEIGTVGKLLNSGRPMLHFAVRSGKLPVDPMKFLK